MRLGVISQNFFSGTQPSYWLFALIGFNGRLRSETTCSTFQSLRFIIQKIRFCRGYSLFSKLLTCRLEFTWVSCGQSIKNAGTYLSYGYSHSDIVEKRLPGNRAIIGSQGFIALY